MKIPGNQDYTKTALENSQMGPAMKTQKPRLFQPGLSCLTGEGVETYTLWAAVRLGGALP